MLATLALTYILVRGSDQIMSGPTISIETALRKRDAYGEDFIWFRSHGSEFLIRDAATLDRIDHLFDPRRALKSDAKRIKHELRPLERRESELDDEIDELTDRDDGPELTATEQHRLDSLRQEMRELRPRLHALERQEEDIDQKMDEREKEAEEKMVPILEDAVRSGIAKPVRN
jgi:seryl-tRNA synthetase